MEEAAAQGQRLLGLAFNTTDNNRTEIEKEDLEKQKIFLGIVGIIDPPRDEAIEAIKECKSAGVEVKMITGDHAITARAIGKKLVLGMGKNHSPAKIWSK
jgi:P-type E1-E2 ATPase